MTEFIDEISIPAPTQQFPNTTIEPESVLDQQQQQQDVRNESLANIEIIVLSVILCLAVAGNALMLLALRRQLQFRPMSRMYFFMFNLSVADLLVAFGNILPQLAWDITYRFVGNDLLCRSVKYCQVFVLYLSTYILTFMAVDRYLVVCHHSFSRTHYNLRGLKGPKIFVVLAWILSFVFAIPQAFIFGYRRVKGEMNVYDCWAEFIEPWGQQAYVLWFVISAFALPLCIIGASYGAICCKVISFNLPKAKPKEKRRKGRSFYSFSSASDAITDSTSGECNSTKRKGDTGTLIRQISQAKIKSIKLTLVVVICFFVCWAPFCVTQLVLTFGPPITRPVQPVLVIFLLLASLNSCTNPWVYLAFSETLFNQLRMLLGFGLGRGSDDASIGDEQEDPPKDRPICKIIIDQAVDHGHGHGQGFPVKSFKVSNDDPIVQVQVETKSEVI